MEPKTPAALHDKGGNNYEFLWEAKESQRSLWKLLPAELLISQLRRCRVLPAPGEAGWAGRSRWRRRCHQLTFNLEGLKAGVCNNLCQETLWTVKTEHGSGFMFQVGMILCNFTSNHLARDITGTHGSKSSCLQLWQMPGSWEDAALCVLFCLGWHSL